MDIGKDLQEAYEQGRRDALNEIMEYTYGMLTAEKVGLQHKIKSMMDTADTPQTEEPYEFEVKSWGDETVYGAKAVIDTPQTDCPWK